jgi:hypothetical protein
MENTFRYMTATMLFMTMRSGTPTLVTKQPVQQHLRSYFDDTRGLGWGKEIALGKGKGF